MNHRRKQPFRRINDRRRRGNGLVQFMRGLVLESTGVVALAALYFAMQSSEANESGRMEKISNDPAILAHEGLASISRDLLNFPIDFQWFVPAGETTWPAWFAGR